MFIFCCVFVVVVFVAYSGNFDPDTNSQDSSDSVEPIPSSVHMVAPQTRSGTYHPMPSHLQQSHEFSTDELTRKVFPVLKGDLLNNHRWMDSSHRRGEKRYHSKSFSAIEGGGYGNGDRNELGNGASSARILTSGVSDSGGGSSRSCSRNTMALKCDPLLGYKIPKLITTCISKEKTLKQDMIMSEHKTTSFNSGVSSDTLPSDPLTLMSDHQPKTEMNLQDMSNNDAASPPDKSCLSPSGNSNSQFNKTPIVITKSSEESTSDPKGLVRRALDVHFDEGRITNRQYKRILERATRKVEEGLVRSSYMNEKRVKKLVADFVKAYKCHGVWT